MTILRRIAGLYAHRFELRRRMARSLLALALAGAIPGGAFAQADNPSPRPGLIIGTTSTDGAGTSIFGNIELSTAKGAKIHITSLTLKNFRRENGRFEADDARFEGIEVKSGDLEPTSLVIPSAALHGLSGPLPDQAAFSTTAPMGRLPPIAEVLLAAKAERIEVPLIQVEGGGHSASYADIVLTGLDDGRLASLIAGKISGISSGTQMSLGGLRLNAADFNPYLDWLDDARAAKATPGLKTVSDSLELEDLSLTEPDGTSKLGKVTITGLKLEPPDVKPSQLFDTLQKMGADSAYADQHPAEAVRSVRAVLTAFSLDSISFEGLNIQSGHDQPLTAALVRFDAVSGRGIGEIRLGDLAGVSKDDNRPFRLGSMSLRGFRVDRLDEFLDALAAGKAQERLDLGDYPQVRATSFAMSDFSGDTSNEGPLRLENLTIDVPRWTGLLPTELNLHVAGLSGQTKNLDDADGRRTLEQLGIDTMVINMDAKLAWDEASNTLAIGPTSAEIEHVAKISLNGTIGNVPRSVFLNPAHSLPDLLSANLHDLSVGLEERGAIRRLLEIAAKQSNVDVHVLPRELAALVTTQLTDPIGPVNAEKLAAALQTFLGNPNKLQVDMKASPPIPLAPLVIGGADQLLDQIRKDVTVDARAD